MLFPAWLRLPFPLRVPEAARQGRSHRWEQRQSGTTKARATTLTIRRTATVLPLWFPVGSDSVPSEDFNTSTARATTFATVTTFGNGSNQGKAVPLMGATPIREQPRQGNNVDHQRNGNRLACWFPVTKPVDLSLYYKL